jgi:hypothetical protein
MLKKNLLKYEKNILKEINIYNINKYILYKIYLSYTYNVPVVKQDITKMSVEELASYVEAVREKRRQRSEKYYDEEIKNDPEKYKMFLNKCKKSNKTYYHSKGTNNII